MKLVNKILFVVMFLLPLMANAGELRRASNPADVIPGQYIVVFKDTAVSQALNRLNRSSASAVSQSDVVNNMVKSLGRKYRANASRKFKKVLKGGLFHMNEAAAIAMAKNSDVDFIEPDAIFRATATQTNPTWGLDRIDQENLPLSKSYTYDTTASNVSIYVIDTGIELSHSDFGGRASSGWDFVDNDSNANDCDGHGTHVAATVAGSTWGVAKNAQLIAVRVLDCNGEGWNSDVIAGMEWVAENHQKPAVANMSLGGGVSSATDSAANALINSGVTLVVAAGNDDANACNESPARVPNAITVASSTSRDSRSSFSNYGSCVDLFAPGSDITSARMGGGSTTWSGTSMASPHVAGVAALYLAGNTNDSPAEVTQAIINNATSNVISDTNSSPNLLVKAEGSNTNPPEEEQDLTNGQAQTISGAKDSWKHFFINVPSGSTNLSMKISGGSGDADLYTRFGAQPTSSSYDCRPYKNGNDEECTVSNPQAGKYYVSMYAYSAYSSVELVATYENTTTPGTEENVVLPANGGVLESFTSEYGSGWDASDLTNGVTNEDGWASKENPGTQEFVYSFSNGQNATLSNAVIHAGTAEGQYYSKDVEVWTSANGSNYTKIADGTLPASNTSITLNLGDTVAKTVKLVITSGYRSDYWELGEFVVNGELGGSPPPPPPSTYALTVNSGGGDGDYTSGTAVTITANSPPSGQIFDRWVVNSGNPSITNVNASSTTLTMPSGAVTVTATYKNQPPSTYALTVNNGSGDGNYTSGTSVTITANAAPNGQVFDRWLANSGNPSIANTNASSTTLTMPSNAVTITATYKNQAPSTYALSVNNGSGDGNYTSGTSVTITANAAPNGQVFDRWAVNSGNPSIGNVNASSTTLTMPSSAVTVTATYKDSSTGTVENVVLPANGGVLESFTSEYGSGWDASDLTNGVTNEDGWASKKDPGTQEFVYSFSNGQNATLSNAVIHGGTAEGQYYSKDVEVWTSANGTNYTKIADGTLPDSNTSITLNLGGTLAKTVKLVITSGYRSDYWELGEFVVNGVLGSSPPSTYALTVNSGNGDGNYSAGTAVTITANAAPNGQVFDRWIANSGNPSIANTNVSSTTLTMPSNAVTITATYKNQAPSTYALTVNSGNGDGDYSAGTAVTITANAAPNGQVFDRWVANSGNPSIANTNASSTTLTMPSNAVTITATYKNQAPSTYALTVNSGGGDGNYTSGTAVTITANAAPNGQVFDRWIVNSGNPSIGNANASSTTLTMPSSAVTVTATYKDTSTGPVENVVLPSKGGVLESFTSEYGSGWVASDLTNGVTNEDGWASEANPDTQEFVYSFSNGQNATLNEAVLHAGTAEGQYYSRDVEVWTSANGTNYTKIADGTLPDSNTSITLNLGGTLAKRVKLVITSGYRSDYWELGEFKVNGVLEGGGTDPDPDPDPDTEGFKFIAYGDSRTYADDHDDICSEINSEDPDLIIHSGDLWDGYSSSEWRSHFTSRSNLNTLLNNNKVLVAQGNHESGSEVRGFSPSIVKNNSTEYSFLAGNVFFVCLGEDPSASYLESQLQKSEAQNADFRVIYHHYPIYSSGSHGENGDSSVEAICDEYNVTMSFSGHDHHYERSEVIYDQSRVYSGTDVPENVQGTTYVVTGGGGAPLYSAGSNWWTDYSESTNHYCVLTAYSDRLEMTVKDINGSVIENFVRRK